MNQTLVYAILAALLGCLMLFATLIGAWYAIHELRTRLPAPAQTSSTEKREPPEEWWDMLQSLTARMGMLESEAAGLMAKADAKFGLARSAEERARKREQRIAADQDDDGAPPDSEEMPDIMRHQVDAFQEEEEQEYAVGSPEWRLAMKRRRRA